MRSRCFRGNGQSVIDERGPSSRQRRDFSTSFSAIKVAELLDIAEAFEEIHNSPVGHPRPSLRARPGSADRATLISRIHIILNIETTGRPALRLSEKQNSPQGCWSTRVFGCNARGHAPLCRSSANSSSRKRKLFGVMLGHRVRNGREPKSCIINRN